MKQNSLLKAFMPHLIAVGIFTVLTWTYLLPQLLENKEIAGHDVIQSYAMQGEIRAYHDSTGHYPLWTNTIFSGMPAYQVLADFPSNLATYLIHLFKAIFPDTAHLVFLLMLGFYILMFTFTSNHWVAIIGAVGFAFSSYNFINIDAGHTNKVRCIALMAPILAGFLAAYRGSYLFGAALTALVLSLQVRSNHVQITYYTMMAGAMIGIFYFILAIKDKQLPGFAKATGALLLAVVLGIGSNTGQLWTTYEYSKDTMRGGDGLDPDYAFGWSYGKLETFTLIIPRYMGGSSHEELGTGSHLAELMTKNNKMSDSQLKKALQETRPPTYWGNQPFTSGPTYFGAISCFLFVLGMFLIRNPVKWVFLAITIVAILLSWGRNFEAFNMLVFKYLPFYNKFRTPAMTLTLANLAVVFVAGLGLFEIFKGDRPVKELKRALYIALGITVGLVFVAGVLGSYSLFDFDFKSPDDTDNAKNGWPVDLLIDDRELMMRMDSLRSLLFIGLTAAAIWIFMESKVKAVYLLAGIGALVLIDNWMVSKRYLNDSDFVSRSKRQEYYRPTKADLEIKKDTDLYYRVFNIASNTFNDAITSYHHNSIGGYHPAKLQRYEDLKLKHLIPSMMRLNPMFSNDDVPVLNMLNMRYVIAKGNQVLPNPNAMGNAWFVPQYRLVENAAAELDSLTKFNPGMVAFADKKFESYLSGLPQLPGVSGGIELKEYHPEKLTYISMSNQEQLAVFSDIYYDKGWQAYIDGNPVEHIRVNYVLRAMRVPAGQHTIVFEFHPKSYYTGEKVSLAFSSLTLLLVIGVVVNELRKFLKSKGREKTSTVAKKK